MLWDALTYLPSSAVFLANISVFAILFTVLGLLCGAVLAFIGENIPEVEEVQTGETLADIQEWASAHDWVEVELPGPAHRHGVWDVAPKRESVPGRRVRGAPQTVWGGASALSRMIEHDIADLFLELRPQFKIRQNPSWLQI